MEQEKSEDTTNGTPHEVILSSSNNYKRRKFDQLPLSLHPSLSLVELSEKDPNLFNKSEIGDCPQNNIEQNQRSKIQTYGGSLIKFC